MQYRVKREGGGVIVEIYIRKEIYAEHRSKFESRFHDV